MRTWKICIQPDKDEAPIRSGYALEKTEQEALMLADHPHAVVFPKKILWPGKPGEVLDWFN